MTPQFVAMPDAGAKPLPFSSAVCVGHIVFVSGQAAIGPDGAVVYGTFEEEMRMSLANLQSVLKRCGGDLEHVVMTRAYLKHGSDLGQFNLLYGEYFRPPYPARTTLSGCLDKLKFEIDAIAVLP